MHPFPGQALSPFTTPEPGTPNGVAFALFQRIATPAELLDLIQYGGVRVHGQWGVDYVVVQNGATYVINERGVLAAGCLVIDAPIPTMDQMIANYLVLKNDEAFYWQTACINKYRPFKTPLDLMAGAGRDIHGNV